MLLFWLVLIGALTAWYVSVPLWRTAARGVAGQATPRSAANQTLRERRDTLLRHLKELEFDRSMEKIEADDYTRLRAAVSAEAATVLRELEDAETARRASGNVASRAVPGQLMSLDIETEILIARARRQNHRAPRHDVNSVSNGSAANGAQANGGNGVTRAATMVAWHCVSCGRGMGENDQFCASCGTRRDAASDEPGA
jgi:uncharacterized Zn finger protein (UPF0148 family)